MRAFERFITYAEIHTTSSEETHTTPSTACQLVLADKLVAELKELGVGDAHRDANGYVYASLPASAGCEDAPVLGLIAHMDTSCSFSGENVHVLEWRAYNGEDVQLPKDSRIIHTAQFPQLKEWKGRTLLTADGSTLLGADDKAGIAEIMTAVETLLQNGAPHGKICIGFTPDEEIGEGADHFDVEHFGADFAYTVDGGPEGEINYETFNAASAKITIEGVSVHPGSAKDVLINALSLAAEIDAQLPNERPENTDGYDGYYFLNWLQGDAAACEMRYIIRDHDRAKFEARKENLQKAANTVAAKYPAAKINCVVTDSYYNMAEIINENLHLIENAKTATVAAGAVPAINPVRGGTDGCRLSYMGLPCPNLGTGGANCHGPFECVTVEGMDIVVKILLELVDIYKTADYANK